MNTRITNQTKDCVHYIKDISKVNLVEKPNYQWVEIKFTLWSNDTICNELVQLYGMSLKHYRGTIKMVVSTTVPIPTSDYKFITFLDAWILIFRLNVTFAGFLLPQRTWSLTNYQSCLLTITSGPGHRQFRYSKVRRQIRKVRNKRGKKAICLENGLDCQ